MQVEELFWMNFLPLIRRNKLKTNSQVSRMTEKSYRTSPPFKFFSLGDHPKTCGSPSLSVGESHGQVSLDFDLNWQPDQSVWSRVFNWSGKVSVIQVQVSIGKFQYGFESRLSIWSHSHKDWLFSLGAGGLSLYDLQQSAAILASYKFHQSPKEDLKFPIRNWK